MKPLNRFILVTLVVLAASVMVTAAVPPPTAAAQGVCGASYTVRRGDTLYSIARRCNTSVTALLLANPGILNPNRIYAGRRLVIPGPGSTTGVFNRVNVYLIDVGGGNIGCGDGVVAVRRDVAPTRAPLTAAINQLLSIKERDYGQSGLVNALYQSNLRLASAAVQSGVATIRLTGELKVGGTCDAPRIEAQLKQTALQFSTVRSVRVFVNGRRLEDVLSSR